MRRLGLLFLLAAFAAAGDEDEPRIWIHAPAEDLLSLYGKKDSGFLITIEEYRRLVELARANEAAARERPPLPGRLVRGACTARVDGDLLRVTASYTAVVQGEAAVQIPFKVEGIALERLSGATLRGDALAFDGPGTYAIEAELSAQLARQGDLLRGAFRLPPAAGHTLELALPPDVEGEVGPIVRAFRSGVEGGRVTGYPDETGLFQLWLKPRAPARRLDALLAANAATLAEIGEARTGLRTILSLQILRAPVDAVEILLAPGQTVRALDGDGVKTWRLVRGGTEDTLEVRFTEPRQETVTLQLETDLPRDQVETAAIPVARVRGAVRYQGTVGVAARPEVKVEGIETSGVRRLPQTPRGTLALFQVWSDDARITATIARVEARAEAITRALLAFREGGKSLQVLFGIEITGDPLFRLEPTLPRGWLLRTVQLDGQDAPYVYEPDGRLVLEFPGGLKPGMHALFVSLDTDEVDWVPNAGTVGFELSGVRSGLAQEQGLLLVASDPAFRVNAEAPQGLTPVGMAEAARAFGGATERMLFAWRFEQPGYTVRFDLERHEPRILATVVTRVVPSERLLAVHATALLDIRRTGVREVKVSLPAGTGPLVDFRGELIKEKRSPESGADPETWTIVFQRRIRGPYRLELTFDKSFESDAWTAVAPEIALPGTQERGFVVVQSSGTTEIAVAREGLREADVGELPEQPEQSPLEVLAYAQHPYRVEISSRRHDPEPVVQAVALSADIYGVVSPDGRVRCRAEYRVRNNDQPFLRLTLPAGSELLGALADGEPIKPLSEEGKLKLPLPRSKDRETPFIVAVVYESRVEELGATGDLALERPALDIEVLETTYTLHLPHGYRITGFDGDLVPLGLRERESVLTNLRVPVPFTGGDAAMPSREVSRVEIETLRQSVESTLLVDSEAANGRAGDVAALRAQIVELQKGLAQVEQAEAQAMTVHAIDELRERNERLYVEALDKAAQLGVKLRDGYADAGLRAELEAGSPPPAAVRPEETADYDAEHPEDVLEEEMEAEKSGTREQLKSKESGRRGGFRRPQGGPAPGLREPADPEPPPPDSGGSAEWEGGLVAHGDDGDGAPTPAPKPAPAKRARPERALLSLDIQFLRPDNVYRLESLAPSGRAELSYARADVHRRQGYLGVVLGGAAALVFFFGRRRPLLRLLPAAVLFLIALHFAGLSFLPAELVKGAATALVAVTGAFVLVRLGTALLHGVRRIRLPWRRGATALVLLAAAAKADDEVLVPYSREPEKIDRVFLPAAEYHRLRALAYPEEAMGATAFVDAQYEAVLVGEELTVRARYQIAKETEAAERLPLALKEVAMTSALLDGRPASLAVEDGGYVLVLEGKGQRTLELELRPRLEAKDDVRSFAVPVRPVATARLILKHDRPQHDPEVAALGAKADALYYLGPVGALSVTFTPRVEPFRAREAELRAETATVVSVRDGFTAVATRVRYGISGGSVGRVRVRVGRDLTVLSASCPDLAGWEVDGDGNLVVALLKPAERSLVLEVRAERKAERERAEAAPEIVPLDVLRDAGVVALETLPDLKIEVLQSRGLLRARLEEAPADLRATADPGVVQSAYRYAVRPFELSWRVFLEETRIRAENAVNVYVDRDKTLAEVVLRATLERGPGPFTLSLPVPAGYEVAAVQGGGLRDWWVRDAALSLDLVQPLTGTQAWRIVLRRAGATSEPFAAPAIALRGAARESGIVRVAVADGLEAEVREASNLLPEDVAKAGGVSWGRLVRAFRYYGTPWRLELSSREEQREVDAIVVSRVVPLADRIRVEALVDFHVRRGLVDGYSFVVPVADEREALVVAHDRREVRSEPVDGGRRFTVTLRTPTRGSAAATVAYDVPYGAEVRGVEPLGAGTVTRYVAVEKAPDGEVRVGETRNLDAADFADLPLRPPETTVQSVARVFVGTGAPFTLALDVRRHAFEQVAKAVVYRALATVVVDRSGWTRALVSYRVYNRSEQFLRLALPEGARLLSVLVAGEGVRPLAEGGDLLVPLRKLALGSPAFDVDVLYAYAGTEVGEETSRVRLPAVRKLDVRRTTVSLHVPRGFSYDFDTEMEEVKEADIVAGDATDLYEEIKEVYAVVKQGNRLQAGRALSNVQQLEQEARRLMDYVRENTRDMDKLQQVDSQERALRRLRESNVAPLPQTALVEPQQEARGIESWEVNRAFFDRARAEQRQQVEEFRAKQQQIAGGAERGDRELERTILGDAPLSGPAQAAGKKVAQEDAKAPPRGAYFNDGADGDLRGRTENVFTAGETVVGIGGGAGGRLPGRAAGEKLDLLAAKGRISLRIDLPKKGDVYHFAQLGGADGVAFDADEEDGVLLEAALALASAAAAVFLLRFRAR